jgi:ribosomal-protein-alanine N-acetyltransferase
MDGARIRGCRLATLEVRPSNAPARALYEAFGFEVVGRRRGYYADTGEDAILLARDLAAVE